MEYLIYQVIKHIEESLPHSFSLVDEDYGQLENLMNQSQDMYPLTYPAVLIELTSVQWSSHQGYNQSGEAMIRIRLILDCYDDTHRGSQTEQASLVRTELYQSLHRELEGFRPDGCGGLMRTTSRAYTWSYGIKVYETNYTCYIEDFQAPNNKLAPAKIRLGLEVSRN